MTIKTSDHWRTDTFKLWHWRRLLRVPWTTRRSNQSIQKEINPECSLKELMLKLKIQYFDYLMRRSGSLENTLILEKIEGRIRGQQRMRWLDSITDSMAIKFNKLKPDILQSMRSQCRAWFSIWIHTHTHTHTHISTHTCTQTSYWFIL